MTIEDSLRAVLTAEPTNSNDRSFREAYDKCEVAADYERLALVTHAKLRSLAELFAGAVRSNDGALEVVEAFVAMSGSELEPSRTIDGLTVFRVTPREVAR